MTELQFVKLNDDGSALVLTDGDDGTFTLPLDGVVERAVRRDRPRPARLETEMDGALRPRDIQARIRAGASVDDVVAESGLDHERIERFAGPMLAEREHVASLARDTEIRRDFAPDLDLASAVAERLEPLGVERSSIDWDAWRREDGRWVVEARYVLGRDQRSGHWAFDPKASSVTADDDEGRWLIDPQAPEPAGTDRGKPRLAAVRTLTTVTEVERETVDVVEDLEGDTIAVIDTDVIETLTETVTETVTFIDVDELDEADAADAEAAMLDDGLAEEAEAALTVLDAQTHADVAEIADEVEEQLTLVDHPESGAGTDDDAAAAPAKARPAAAARQSTKRKGRASVPTWDDIVFGSRKSSE